MEPSKRLILSLTQPTGSKARILIVISKTKMKVKIVFALIYFLLHVQFCFDKGRKRKSVHHHCQSVENHSYHYQVVERLTVDYAQQKSLYSRKNTFPFLVPNVPVQFIVTQTHYVVFQTFIKELLEQPLFLRCLEYFNSGIKHYQL